MQTTRNTLLTPFLGKIVSIEAKVVQVLECTIVVKVADGGEIVVTCNENTPQPSTYVEITGEVVGAEFMVLERIVNLGSELRADSMDPAVKVVSSTSFTAEMFEELQRIQS